MGYGLPAALGAKLGAKDKEVVLVVGDGGLQMSLAELATLVQEDANVKIMLLNNGYLGMVRELQQELHEGRYNQTLMKGNPDFVKLAEAMGAVGIRVTKREELAGAIQKAIELNTTVVLDCIIDSDDKVFPMVPAGANIEDAFDEEDLKAKEK